MASTYLWRKPTCLWMGSNWDETQISHTDPYLIWADSRGGLPNNIGQIPILAELAQDATIAKLRALISNGGGIAAVTSLYPNASPSGVNSRFCTLHVRRSFFRNAADYGILRYVIGWVRTPLATQIQPQIVWEELIRRPVIAIIDDGLPFLHEAYRYTDSQSRKHTRVTRFKSLDMKLPLELKQEQIESHLGENEQLAYQSLGYERVARDESHGSHLMDVAAGKNGNGIAGSLSVVAVQLPTETVIDSSGGSLAVHAADAFRYVLNQVPENQPVVTCMSYGIHAGPHDGSSVLECALDEMLLQRPKAALVIPAGNNYLVRGHARMLWPSEQLQNLVWRIQPGDLTDSFCELWFDEWHDSATDHPPFEIALTPPQATDQWHDKPGAYAMYKAQENQLPIASVVLQRLQRAGKVRWMALLCVAGTVHSNGAPHGLWEIKIKAKNESQTMAVDAWIERDGAVFGGNSGGLQSYFEGTSNEAVTGVGTLNGIATGSEPIVVGAYVEQTGKISSYSASGADYFLGATKRPLCSAVGDVDADMRGVKAAGTRSGTYCWLSGTSVAAAMITRRVANLWAANQSMARNEIKSKLVENLPAAQTVDNLRAGAGKISP
jgi:hypothetical protein